MTVENKRTSDPHEDALMIEKVSINIRPDDRHSLDLIRDLISFLDRKNISVLLPDIEILRVEEFSAQIADAGRFVDEAQLVVVIGGDGTFLRTARLFAHTNTPLFGINRGRLGFLTEFSPEESFKYLESFINEEFSATTRAILEVMLVRDGREIEKKPFFNDAVISKGAFSRPIRIDLELDNSHLSSYSGDGLIIATATGSTAYSLSAGGPIVVPSIENVYILNPICPHTLAMRPMIIPSTATLGARIISTFENLLLTIDGQEAIPIEGNDEIIVRGSSRKIFLIPHPDRDYYAILRQKLGWGKNMDD